MNAIRFAPKSHTEEHPYLPANFSVAHARLPASYEHAKTALAECASIDECVDWADKSEALAAYARQADDDVLEQYAKRIRARAIRRCGELLKQIEPAKNQHDASARAGSGPSSRSEAGEAAGMSGRQIKTAIRVANIPADRFEHQVDSEAPPTITALAEQGKKHRAHGLSNITPEVYDMIAGSTLDTNGYVDSISTLSPNDQFRAVKRDLSIARHQTANTPTHQPTAPARPKGFAAATNLIGTVEEFAAFCRSQDPETIAAAVMPHEITEVREHVGTIDGWLDRFVVNLKG